MPCILNPEETRQQHPKWTSSSRRRERTKALLPGLAIGLLVACCVFYTSVFEAALMRRALFNAAIPHPWMCTFYPDATEDCDKLMATRLPPAVKYRIPGTKEVVDRQRWLFFGDSTMSKLYHNSALKNTLNPHNRGTEGCPVTDIVCSEKTEKLGHPSCGMHDFFGLERTKTWIPPDGSKFEGPFNFGKRSPYCKDCSSCQSHFHECSYAPKKMMGNEVKPNRMRCSPGSKQAYGGYFTQNFARDVELQTPEFRTTQVRTLFVTVEGHGITV